jgi:hypothetical protein
LSSSLHSELELSDEDSAVFMITVFSISSQELFKKFSSRLFACLTQSSNTEMVMWSVPVDLKWNTNFLSGRSPVAADPA